MYIQKLTVAQIQRALRINAYYSTRRAVKTAYNVTDTDYTCDGKHVVVFAVVDKVRGKSSSQITSDYHAHFHSASQWPKFEDKPVDIQFVYDDEDIVNPHIALDEAG